MPAGMTPVRMAAAVSPATTCIRQRPGPQLSASCARRGRLQAVGLRRRHLTETAAISRFGVPEETSAGGWMQTFGFELEGGKVLR